MGKQRKITTNEIHKKWQKLQVRGKNTTKRASSSCATDVSGDMQTVLGLASLRFLLTHCRFQNQALEALLAGA